MSTKQEKEISALAAIEFQFTSFHTGADKSFLLQLRRQILDQITSEAKQIKP